ncbi:MAG TPA: PAS domain S-box protein [Candidatus Elarobacter sp.]|nr:PAS domain S-box protein [Candidatus Elarobacter sp.]
MTGAADVDLGALLEHAPAIVYVARPDGSIAYANAAWERFTGLPVETVLEHGWSSVLHPDDASRAGAEWLAAMASAAVFREEFRIRDRAGEFRWVISHAIPTFDAGGTVSAWYGTVIPIDERRTAEAALASLADAIPQLVWANDAAGNALHVNRRWIEYTGLSFDESLGRGWTHVLHADDVPDMEAVWAEALTTGTFHSERAYRLRRHDGAYRWFVVRAVAVRDESGAILRWYGTNTDVDDAYRAAQRRTMLDRLGAAFAESLDYERTARTVVSAMCEDFADFAFIDVVEDDRLQRIAVESGRLSAEPASFRTFAPPPEAERHPINLVLRTGRTQIVAQCDDAWRRATTWSDEHYAFVATLPMASIAHVPMIAAGERIGVLTFGAALGTGRSFTQADLDEAEEIARRAAVALANARLYRDLAASEERYRGLIDTAQEGVWIIDGAANTRYVNAHMAEMLGYTPDEMYGRWFFDFADPREHEAARQAIQEHRGGSGIRRESQLLHKDGRIVCVIVASNPIADADGAYNGSLGMFTDITERKALETQYRVLAEAGEVLAASLDLAQTFPALAALTVRNFADVCRIHECGPDGTPRLIATAYADSAHGNVAAAHAGEGGFARVVVANAIASGESLYVPHIEPALREGLGAQSLIVVPLVARGATLGAITLVAAADGAGTFVPDDLRLAELLAKRAAVAIDNARLYDEERRLARMREVVARASDVLSGSLDLDALLGRFADLLVAELAAEATIALDAERTVDTERAVVRRSAAVAGDAAVLRVALRHRDTVVGTVTLRANAPFGANDVALLHELAARAAVAIENAQLYAREHRVAMTLQRAMLPAVLPEVAGLAFDAVYFPGATEAEIGGDWYDAIALPDGRVVVSIGDVTGRGLTAAVIMGRMRQAIETLSTYESDPVRLLDAADGVLRRAHPDAIVTALVGVVDPAARTLAYATAGHPTPIVRASDGTLRQLPGRGLPLGLREGREPPATTVVLPPSSLVVFFTDGLVESTRDIDEGERRVFAALADPALADGLAPAAALVARVLDDGIRDDVAVLTMRVSATPSEARDWTMRWRFDPHDWRRAYDVRETLAETLSAAAANVDLPAAELVFGELVGNAVRHAPGFVDVELTWDDDATPVLHVIDDGPGYRPQTDLPSPDSESGRGLYIVAQLTREFTVMKLPRRGAHARAVLLTRA